MQPSEFWGLHPTHFWWLAEYKTPAKMYGSMTESEVQQIYAETYGDDEDGGG